MQKNLVLVSNKTNWVLLNVYFLQEHLVYFVKLIFVCYRRVFVCYVKVDIMDFSN